MKAAYYEQTGPAHEVFRVGDVETPHAGAGEVRVRVGWSGVNPSDVKSRRGGSAANPAAFPRVIPHSDGAGVIDEVGAGIDAARLGQSVWTWNAGWRRAFGTAAEYVVLPAEQVVPLPAAVEPMTGACFGIPALTACHAIGLAGGVRGQRVLVAGGAGAVGHYAVQFARHAGADKVIATVGSDEKAASATAAGADAVINYKSTGVAEQIRTANDGRGIDRIIEVDASANLEMDFELVAEHGSIVVYGNGGTHLSVPFFPAIVKNIAMHFFAIYTIPVAARAAAIATLNQLLAGGALVHQIGATRKLDQIAEAHELVEFARVLGNVVIEID